VINNFFERWPEIEPLIDQMFDVPAAERINWLRMHCDDLSLRALVAQALDNAAGIESLERGMARWLPAFAKNLSETLPVITGYRVLRFVGAGGMASVFEAERELPCGQVRPRDPHHGPVAFDGQSSAVSTSLHRETGATPGLSQPPEKAGCVSESRVLQDG
jgi:hypothetical protein